MLRFEVKVYGAILTAHVGVETLQPLGIVGPHFGVTFHELYEIRTKRWKTVAIEIFGFFSSVDMYTHPMATFLRTFIQINDYTGG